MLCLGPYELKNPWILAPMAGVSQMPFRVLAREMGAAAAPTELISAKGLQYNQERTRRFLRHDPSESPFWVQLFGGDPDSMADGAERAVDLGADVLDINMGCPVKKVTKNGAGSALLCDPKRVGAIVQAVAKRTGLPVTVKIRSGWDASTINATDVVKAAADAGCVAVALHARTRAQGYSGTADWRLIEKVVEASPVPVIGNGDAATASLAQRMLRETGCQGVMIGRGALGNPWIFRELSSGEGRPTPAERWLLVQRHLNDHIADMGDAGRAIRSFRQHLAWYSHGLRGAARFRREVMTLLDVSAVHAACERFFSQAGVDAPAGPSNLPHVPDGPG